MKCWIAVVSRAHVKRGIAEEIVQVCHGKQGPLKRMKPGDCLIYYSPTEKYGEKVPCRRFTAIGVIQKGEPYQFQMSEDFIPWRRDMSYLPAHEVAIEPLLDSLSFIKNKSRWGYMFRFGLFEIPCDDATLIAQQMGVDIKE